MSKESIQMSQAKLMEYISSQNFKSLEEINEFFEKNVMGRRIDDLDFLKKKDKSNEDLSNDLMYEAYDIKGAKGIKLAKQALQLFPENVRALTYLADHENDKSKALGLYQRAVDVGKNLLGEQFFKKHTGHFWGLSETRPYMNARKNYADMLQTVQRDEEAIAEYQEMIKLNPNDNQGIRYSLSHILLKHKKYDQYHQLYLEYKDEATAFWLFNYALFVFATQGPSLKAFKALKAANAINKHVLQFITGKRKIKSMPQGYYGIGDENEATYYLMDNLHIWGELEGSLEWVFHFLENKSK